MTFELRVSKLLPYFTLLWVCMFTVDVTRNTLSACYTCKLVLYGWSCVVGRSCLRRCSVWIGKRKFQFVLCASMHFLVVRKLQYFWNQGRQHDERLLKPHNSQKLHKKRNERQLREPLLE